MEEERQEEGDWFDPSPFIEDSHKLVDVIGEWPSFDDASILSVQLNRTDGIRTSTALYSEAIALQTCKVDTSWAGMTP